MFVHAILPMGLLATCCSHNALIDMLLNAAPVVPADIVLARPSLHKLCTGSRGMAAGTKCKLLLARIEAD